MYILIIILYILISTNLLFIISDVEGYYNIGLILSFILHVLVNISYQSFTYNLDKDLTNKFISFSPFDIKWLNKYLFKDNHLIDISLLIFLSNILNFFSVLRLNEFKAIDSNVYFTAYGMIRYTFTFLIVITVILLGLSIYALYGVLYVYNTVKNNIDKENKNEKR